jgi:hypothetical protein
VDYDNIKTYFAMNNSRNIIAFSGSKAPVGSENGNSFQVFCLMALSGYK